jgi:TonB family protein
LAWLEMGKVTNSKRNLLAAFIVALALHAGAGIYISRLLSGDGDSSIGFKNGRFSVSLELPQPAPAPSVQHADEAQMYIPRDQPPAETREIATPAVPDNHADSGGNAVSNELGVETLSVGDSDISARYPLGARMRGEEGVAVVEAVIDASGRAHDIVVSRSSGYPALDAEAVKAMKEASFVVRKGTSIENDRISKSFRFKLTN